MEAIKIFDSHRPALDPGTYKITVVQEISAAGNALTIDSPVIDFIVAGEQYTIDPQQIDSVFPPAAGMGDFSLVLPHIVLNRSTLPWEREAQKGISGTPWLALLLFTEDEMASSEENTENKQFFVKHLLKKDWVPSITTNNKDLISIIVYKEKDPVKKILPMPGELPWLAHVRSGDSDEKGVVVCNRIPVMDKKNMVHLVSLENRFDAQGEFINEVNGNMALVSLNSWEFYCNDHFIITKEVLDVYNKIQDADAITTKLDSDKTAKDYQGSSLVDQPLKDALSEVTGQEYFDEKELIKALPGNYKQSVDTSSDKLTDTDKANLVRIGYLLKTFRIGHLPDILNHLNRTPGKLRPKDDNLYSEQGYLSVPYTLKTGKEMEAFYRGPLVPASQVINDAPIAFKHSDEALRFFKDVSKLEVSYASAWQLGKLLALQNKNFSTALYQWKRNCYQAIKQKNNVTGQNCPVPAYVADWFNNLKALKGIPFNYLVADPSFIPFESICFFSVDETWIKHIIDGAFSIGRISEAETAYDLSLYRHPDFEFLDVGAGGRSGFLLHSVAVAGWPDLVIHGTGEPLDPGRVKEMFDELKNTSLKIPAVKRRLSQNLLLCLFDIPLSAVSIHQKPESIHFGFEDDEQAGNYKGITALYNSVNKLPETDKLPDTSLEINHGLVAKFVNSLVQQIEVVTFNAV